MAAGLSHRFLCGVPKDECQGSGVGAPGGLGKHIKCHASPQEAFKCHAQYLIKHGYKQISQNEFISPVDGYVRVLTRKGKFGGKMRKGKVGEKGSSKGVSTRVVPKGNTKHAPLGGHILSI